MIAYDFAKQFIGRHELKDRDILMNLFKRNAINDDIVIDPSRIPWCAAFINACEREAGHQGTGKLNARSFLKYGNVVDSIKQAVPGDIVIFTRGGSTWQGHVAYFDGLEESRNGTLIRTIGGNQSDSVSKGWYRLDRLIGIRRSE